MSSESVGTWELDAKVETVALNSYGDVTLTAHWRIDPYTITYDYDGGALPEGQENPTGYNVESEAFTLINPTRDGYTFAGWTGTGLTEATLEVTVPTGSVGNRSYQATWSPNVYTASFNSVGGTVVESFNYTIVDEDITLTTEMQRDGYTFSKWIVETADGNWVAGADATTITTGHYGDVTFRAVWTAVTYEISYDLDGGADQGANPLSYNIESAPITLTAPTKTGYIFTGWTGTDLAEATVDVTIPTGEFGDRSYTATWRPITYTVVYDANDGTGAPASFTKTYDTPATLTSDVPTRTGYVFSVWKIGEDQYPAGATMNRDYTTEDGATVTLNAFWNKGNYDVIYVGNVIGDTAKVTGLEEVTITITPQADCHLTTITQIKVGSQVLSSDAFTALVSTNKRTATVTLRENVIYDNVTITVGTTDHSMQWFALNENSCQKRCEVCGTIEVESAPHTLITKWIDSGDGATHYKECTKCGTKILAAHTGGSATCSTQCTCDICGASYGDYAPHVLTEVPAVAPTCTKKGSIQYWICANCGKCFSDAEGQTRINKSATVLDKIPHDFTGEIKDNGNGTHSFLCSYGCGIYGGATAHTFDRLVASEAYYKSSVTCDSEATYYMSCACGAKGTATFIGAPIGHNYETKHGVPATCTEPGISDYLECSRCGDIQGKETVMALGHGNYLFDSSQSGKVYDGTFEWATYSCSRGCGSHYVLFTVYAKDNAGKPVEGAYVTITGAGMNSVGATDRNGIFAPDTHFTDGEYKVTIEYSSGDFKASSTGDIRVANGRTSGGIGMLKLVPVEDSDSHSGSSSSGGFRCSFCDTYEANRNKPFVGIFYTIIHWFIHLIQRIIYAFSRK